MAAQLDAWLGGLLAQMAPSARRALARAVAKGLQQRSQRRIAAQLNPDGSAFAPRQPQLRMKGGRIRRTMFAKLRTSRFLKTDSTPEAAVLGFVAQVERIARVHQLGLRDRVSKGGVDYQYPVRQLLGFSDTDISAIQDQVLTHLTR